MTNMTIDPLSPWALNETDAEVTFGTVLDKDLKERDERYGKFENSARVSQEIKCALRSGVNWHRMPHGQREALEMIASKMARLVNGNCNEQPDSWYDIAGFAKLGSREFG